MFGKQTIIIIVIIKMDEKITTILSFKKRETQSTSQLLGSPKNVFENIWFPPMITSTFGLA